MEAGGLRLPVGRAFLRRDDPDGGAVKIGEGEAAIVNPQARHRQMLEAPAKGRQILFIGAEDQLDQPLGGPATDRYRPMGPAMTIEIEAILTFAPHIQPERRIEARRSIEIGHGHDEVIERVHRRARNLRPMQVETLVHDSLLPFRLRRAARSSVVLPKPAAGRSD